MFTDHVLELLIAERNKLNRAIDALQEDNDRTIRVPLKKPEMPKASADVSAAHRTKRHLSAAVRRKMALGQKKRWAALKGATPQP
jgi:hypothetical protein